MRALRFILIAFAVLLAFVLAGAWIGPAMLDWGRYRDTIASLASAALGRQVHIDGAITLQLLPEPILTATRITVLEGRDAASPDTASLSVRRVRLRVALGPLLAGRVDARELVLDQPELRLAWPLDPDSLPDRPSWLASLMARIEGGTLVLGGVTIGDISASVTSDAESGALSGAGQAQLFGQTWRFTARLGAQGRDGSTVLQATLDGLGRMRDSGGRFSGQIAPDGSLQGQIGGRGPDLSLLLPAPAVPWRAEGRLTASGGLAAADELALEIAGSPARGAVALRVAPMPRLDVALAASRLDLDAWLPVLLRGTPGALETGIDLSAEAATLAGGTLRGLRSAFDLGPDGVIVRDASAILPGEAAIRLSGAVQARPGPPGGAERAPFQGSAAISLPDLRATLRWLEDAHLGLSLAALPPDVLRAGQLSADVKLDRQSAALTNVSGTIDGTRIAGRAGLDLAPARPRLDLHLQLDRLALDPWLPELTASLKAVPRLASGAFDATIHLQAAEAVWRGVQADAVSLDAMARPGAFRVQLLDGSVQGVHAALSATVADSGRITDGDFSMAADDARSLAGPLARVVPQILQPPAAVFAGPISVKAQLSGPPEAIAGRVELDLADAQLSAQPTINLATGGWSGTVTLRHPGAPRLLELMGLRGAAGWLGDGSLSLISQVSFVPGRVTADRFDLTAGGLRAEGSLNLSGIGAPAPILSGRVAAETLPLPLPRLRSADPLPFQALRGWRADLHLQAAHILGDGLELVSQARADLTLDSGQFHLSHVAAKLADGALAVDVRIDTAAEPPRVALQGSLTGVSPGAAWFGTPVDLAAGSLDAAADLTAQGYASATLLATLAGSAQVNARGGSVSGLDVAAAKAALAATPDGAVVSGVRAALGAGSTSFDRLDGKLTVSQGAATLRDVTMVSGAGTVAVAGPVDLTAGGLDLLAVVVPAVPDPPALRLRLIGPPAAPVHLPDLSDLTRWLAARSALVPPAPPAPSGSPSAPP